MLENAGDLIARCRCCSCDGCVRQDKKLHRCRGISIIICMDRFSTRASWKPALIWELWHRVTAGWMEYIRFALVHSHQPRHKPVAYKKAKLERLSFRHRLAFTAVTGCSTFESIFRDYAAKSVPGSKKPLSLIASQWGGQVFSILLTCKHIYIKSAVLLYFLFSLVWFLLKVKERRGFDDSR